MVCSVPNLLRSPVRPVLGPVVQPLAHARSRGGGVPSGYLALRYKDGNGNYRSLIYNSGAAVYRVLAYKREA